MVAWQTKKNRRRNEQAVGYTHDAGGRQQGGHSSGGEEGVEKVRNTSYIPWSVYIGTIVYEQSDDHVVSTGTSGMEREYAVDDRVDRLAMRDGIFCEADVSGSGSGMET